LIKIKHFELNNSFVSSRYHSSAAKNTNIMQDWTAMFGLLFAVGCADYDLPDNAYLLDDGRHDDGGDVTLRVACVHDNATTWSVACQDGRWTTQPETVVVDCAHARLMDPRDASAVRAAAAAAASTNQGPCLRCRHFSCSLLTKH